MIVSVVDIAARLGGSIVGLDDLNLQLLNIRGLVVLTEGLAILGHHERHICVVSSVNHLVELLIAHLSVAIMVTTSENGLYMMIIDDRFDEFFGARLHISP